MSASTGQAAVWSRALTSVLLPRLNSPTTATVTARCSHHRADPGQPFRQVGSFAATGEGAARVDRGDQVAHGGRPGTGGPRRRGRLRCGAGSAGARAGWSGLVPALVPALVRLGCRLVGLGRGSAAVGLDLAAARGSRPPTRGSGGSWRRRPPPPRWGACSCCTGSSPSRRPSSPWGSHRAPHQCQASERRPDGAAGESKRGSGGDGGPVQRAAGNATRRARPSACSAGPTSAGRARPRALGSGARRTARRRQPPSADDPSRGAALHRRPGATAVPPRRRPPPAPAPPSPAGTPCPQCGQDNPATRRFCSRCGHPLVAAAPRRRRPARAGTPQRGWWDPERQRAARREYRRSLPPLYRWRRVLVALACSWPSAVVLTLTGNNPVGWAQERWRELTVTWSRRRRDRRRPAAGLGGADVRRREAPGSRQEAWATAWPAGADRLRTVLRSGPAAGRDRAPLGRADAGARARRLGGARRRQQRPRPAVPAQAAGRVVRRPVRAAPPRADAGPPDPRLRHRDRGRRRC